MSARRAPPRAVAAANASGFTLMEMLVTLVLISFATMLMFQMLGSYRLANDRVRSQAGNWRMAWMDSCCSEKCSCAT